MKLFTAVLLTFIIIGYSFAGVIQSPDSFSPGWEKSETLKFAGNDLYGYINGGAELFYEFGFEVLIVERYSRGLEELTLDVYMMTCPEAALGIYLSKCGQETPVKALIARNTGNSSQYSIVRDKYFIQVNNFSFEQELIPDMTSLANHTLLNIFDNPIIEILNKLPSENLIPGSQRLIRGQYALQPIYTFGKGDILQLKGEVFGIVGDYNDDSGDFSHTKIIIPYGDDKKAVSAYNHLINNLDQYIKIIDKTTYRFVFKDFSGKYGFAQLSDSTINIHINMKSNPDIK
ncbi:MAG: hypothetical protein GY855_12200 [candidate division Zixibacteria bacterium]|nr:hypothetical protein [candidate division Zixibacteria bacterium]